MGEISLRRVYFGVCLSSCLLVLLWSTGSLGERLITPSTRNDVRSKPLALLHESLQRDFTLLLSSGYVDTKITLHTVAAMLLFWEAALSLTLATCCSAQSAHVSLLDQILSTRNQSFAPIAGSASDGVGYRREIHALRENEDGMEHISSRSRPVQRGGRERSHVILPNCCHSRPAVCCLGQ